MSRLAALWDRCWFARVDGTPFALARVGIALAGIHLWLGNAPLVRQFYSDAGEFPISEARAWSAEWVARFLMPDVLGGYPAATAIFALWGIALVGLALGWRTRLAAWGNWLLFAWLFHRNLFLADGGDEVFRLVSLVLALGYTALPTGRRALTLDRRRAAATGSAADTGMVAWPLRFIQLQIAVVYLASGFWKLVGPPWWDGSAIHVALANPTFSRFGAPAWGWLHLPYAAIGLAIAWWEFLFPALAVGRRTRLGALAFGVALNVAIVAFMNLGAFPIVMVGCYPAFLKGDEARELVRRVGRWLRTGRQASVERRTSAPRSVSS